VLASLVQPRIFSKILKNLASARERPKRKEKNKEIIKKPRRKSAFELEYNGLWSNELKDSYTLSQFHTLPFFRLFLIPTENKDILLIICQWNLA